MVYESVGSNPENPSRANSKDGKDLASGQPTSSDPSRAPLPSPTAPPASGELGGLAFSLPVAPASGSSDIDGDDALGTSVLHSLLRDYENFDHDVAPQAIFSAVEASARSRNKAGCRSNFSTAIFALSAMLLACDHDQAAENLLERYRPFKFDALHSQGVNLDEVDVSVASVLRVEIGEVVPLLEPDEAIGLLRTMVFDVDQKLGWQDPVTIELHMRLANYYFEMDQLSEAESSFKEVVDKIRSVEDSPQAWLDANLGIAQCCIGTRRIEEVDDILAEVDRSLVGLREHLATQDHREYVASTKITRGFAQLRCDEPGYDGAISLFKDAIEYLVDSKGRPSGDVQLYLDAIIGLAGCYLEVSPLIESYRCNTQVISLTEEYEGEYLENRISAFQGVGDFYLVLATELDSISKAEEWVDREEALRNKLLELGLIDENGSELESSRNDPVLVGELVNLCNRVCGDFDRQLQTLTLSAFRQSIGQYENAISELKSNICPTELIADAYKNLRDVAELMGDERMAAYYLDQQRQYRASEAEIPEGI